MYIIIKNIYFSSITVKNVIEGKEVDSEKREKRMTKNVI